jgi:glucose dehydrogenase
VHDELSEQRGRTRAGAVSLRAGAAVLVALCATVIQAARVERSAAPVNDSARFSPLTDITRENVTSLAVAWTYHTGDFSGGSPTPAGPVPGVQTRPLFADDRVYVTTPSSIVIAIDGDTGAEVWRFDPQAGAP